MACRPAYLIALLFATFCFLLPACRNSPYTHLPQSQTTLAKHDLSVAIFRFWSGAVPFCEQYFQFAAQEARPSPPQPDVVSCGEQLTQIDGCRRKIDESVKPQYPHSMWVRIDYVGYLAQSSAHQSCRYRDHSITM